MAGQTSALGAGTLGQREIGSYSLRLLADGASAGGGVGEMAELAIASGWGVVQEWERRAITENSQSNYGLTADRPELTVSPRPTSGGNVAVNCRSAADGDQ